MNHIKKTLVFIVFVLSFVPLKSQTFDLTNQRTCSVEDDLVINSDTLLLDVTKNIFIDNLTESTNRDLIRVLAGKLQYNILGGLENTIIYPETTLDFFILDCQFWFYDNKIIRDVRKKLKGKVVVFTLEDEEPKVLTL
jgi:hypothetical protein